MPTKKPFSLIIKFDRQSKAYKNYKIFKKRGINISLWVKDKMSECIERWEDES